MWYVQRVYCFVSKFSASSQPAQSSSDATVKDWVPVIILSIFSSNIHRIQRCCQNTAARLILQQWGTPVQYLVDRLHWLPIRVRIDFKIATLTLTYKTVFRPSGIPSWINLSVPTFSLTSNQLLLTVPRVNLTIGSRAFSCSSPLIRNAIPLSVRDDPSMITFKRRLKSFYFHSFVS